MNKTVMNYFYATFFHLASILSSVITVPYLTRIFLPSDLGVAAGATSLVQFLMLVGGFGSSYYGSKLISKNRYDERNFAAAIKAVFSMQFVMSFIILLIAVTILSVANFSEKGVYLIAVFSLLATAIDVSWFFAGLEEFRITALRNVLIRIFATISIFLFIRSSNDIYIYVLINVLSNIFATASLWYYVRKRVDIMQVIKAKVDFREHIKPAFILLLPLIFSYVYTTLDRFYLQIIGTTTDAGFYEQSMMMVRTSIIFVTTIGGIMLPKMTLLLSQKLQNSEEIKKLMTQSFSIAVAISILITAGIYGGIANFVSWFYGPEFQAVIPYYYLLAPLPVLVACSQVIGQQYLIPSGKDKKVAITFGIAAILSVTLNTVLIPKFGGFGACMTILLVEFFAGGIQLYHGKNSINRRVIAKDGLKYLVSAIAVVVVMKGIEMMLGTGIFPTIIMGGSAVLVYLLLIYLLKVSILSEIGVRR